MKKLILFLALLLPVSLFLAGCGDMDNKSKKANSDSKKQLTVYTTVYPLQFFTEQIGGEAVKVETIYPPGSDAHTFEPSQKDMIKLAEADLFFYVGLGLEGFVENAKKTLEAEKVTMVAAGENIDLEKTESEEDTHAHTEDEVAAGTEEDGHEHAEDDGHNHGDIDPHVWIDPVYSKEMAETIKDVLVKQMPEKEDEFTKNYEALAKRLDDLNKQFTDTIGQAKNKEIIVSHAAYGYWEARYGLEQISIAGLSSSSEPSQKELEEIVATAKKHDIKYIFFEQNTSSKLTETVQKEIGAEPLKLHNLAVLTSDDVEKNLDYFKIMNNNLEGLKKALNN